MSGAQLGLDSSEEAGRPPIATLATRDRAHRHISANSQRRAPTHAMHAGQPTTRVSSCERRLSAGEGRTSGAGPGNPVPRRPRAGVGVGFGPHAAPGALRSSGRRSLSGSSAAATSALLRRRGLAPSSPMPSHDVAFSPGARAMPFGVVNPLFRPGATANAFFSPIAESVTSTYSSPALSSILTDADEAKDVQDVLAADGILAAAAVSTLPKQAERGNLPTPIRHEVMSLLAMASAATLPAAGTATEAAAVAERRRDGIRFPRPPSGHDTLTDASDSASEAEIPRRRPISHHGARQPGNEPSRRPQQACWRQDLQQHVDDGGSDRLLPRRGEARTAAASTPSSPATSAWSEGELAKDQDGCATIVRPGWSPPTYELAVKTQPPAYWDGETNGPEAEHVGDKGIPLSERQASADDAGHDEADGAKDAEDEVKLARLTASIQLLGYGDTGPATVDEEEVVVRSSCFTDTRRLHRRCISSPGFVGSHVHRMSRPGSQYSAIGASLSPERRAPSLAEQMAFACGAGSDFDWHSGEETVEADDVRDDGDGSEVDARLGGVHSAFRDHLAASMPSDDDHATPSRGQELRMPRSTTSTMRRHTSASEYMRPRSHVPDGSDANLVSYTSPVAGDVRRRSLSQGSWVDVRGREGQHPSPRRMVVTNFADQVLAGAMAFDVWDESVALDDRRGSWNSTVLSHRSPILGGNLSASYMRRQTTVDELFAAPLAQMTPLESVDVEVLGSPGTCEDGTVSPACLLDDAEFAYLAKVPQSFEAGDGDHEEPCVPRGQCVSLAPWLQGRMATVACDQFSPALTTPELGMMMTKAAPTPLQPLPTPRQSGDEVCDRGGIGDAERVDDVTVPSMTTSASCPAMPLAELNHSAFASDARAKDGPETIGLPCSTSTASVLERPRPATRRDAFFGNAAIESIRVEARRLRCSSETTPAAAAAAGATSQGRGSRNGSEPRPPPRTTSRESMAVEEKPGRKGAQASLHQSRREAGLENAAAAAAAKSSRGHGRSVSAAASGLVQVKTLSETSLARLAAAKRRQLELSAEQGGEPRRAGDHRNAPRGSCSLPSSASLPTLFVARTASQRRRGDTGVSATQPHNVALAKMGIRLGIVTRTSRVEALANPASTSGSCIVGEEKELPPRRDAQKASRRGVPVIPLRVGGGVRKRVPRADEGKRKTKPEHSEAGMEEEEREVASYSSLPLLPVPGGMVLVVEETDVEVSEALRLG